MNAIRFVLPFMKEQWVWFGIGLTLTGMLSFVTWAGPKVVAYTIDVGVLPQERAIVLKGVVWIALVELGRILSVVLSQRIYAVLGQNVIERVRSKMLAHLLKLPIPYFDRVTSGSMMTRVVNDANSMTDFFQSGFVSILGNFASIVAVFVGLISLDARLGWILLITFLPSFFACVYFSERLRVTYEQVRNQLSFLNSVLADFLFGMKTIRSLGLGFLKRQKLNRQIQRYADAQRLMVRTFALFHPTYTLGMGLMMLVWLWVGLPLVDSHLLPMGEWIAALTYILALQNPLIEISDRWNFFLAGLTSIDRISEVMRESIEFQRPLILRTLSAGAPKEISFVQVGFRYPEASQDLLRDVSFTLRLGDRVGLVGQSGSGKSTLLQMMFSFYQPTSGSLLWNGVEMGEFQPKSIRRHFGVVEQFPFLFAGSVSENIGLFDPEGLSVDALKRQFRGFPLIERLLSNPDAMIRERGENLSMGERQMLSFLRAYRNRPTIWILDEATAFFDAQAEQEFMRALSQVQDQVILVQVAHRPEVLRNMTQVFSVSAGRVTVLGSPRPSPSSR